MYICGHNSDAIPVTYLYGITIKVLMQCRYNANKRGRYINARANIKHPFESREYNTCAVPNFEIG